MPELVRESPGHNMENPQQCLENLQSGLENPQHCLENPQQWGNPQSGLENPQHCLENPQGQLENPQSQLENPQQCLENPQSQLENPQHCLENPQSGLENPQQCLENPQIGWENPQHYLENPQSGLENPQHCLENLQTGQEYVNSIIANGGENNPQVMAKIEPLRKALTEPCPPSNVRLREWYEHQAQAIGCTINQVPLGHMPLQADDQQIVSMFTSVAFIYDFPHCPHGGASTVRGNPPAKDSEPKEGEMTDDLFKDEDRS
ncbi:hypothetical protein BKA82DRAFT_4347451 [Pisolithus tinctorius]|nr:hypothetical protein BKA82DRAFT_4347451 [Pisolithus tinctorius]